MKKTHAHKRTAASRLLAVLVTTALGLPLWVHAQEPPPATTNDQTRSDNQARTDVQGQGQQTGSTQEIGAMVSTGTILQQSEVATSLPVTTFDRETIDRTGATTVTDLLKRLPQSSGARFSETVNTGVSFSPGAAAISLRGLNVNATLVLLNGRRMPVFALAQSGTDSFVDINSIPLAAIERVEILREGASAIYGSDAIAGVVNIITRSGIDNTEIFGQYGNTTRQDDASTRHGSLVTGMNKERFRWMFAVDYFQQNPLAARDRDFSRSADHRDQGGTDQRSVRPNPGTIFSPIGTVRPPVGWDGSRLSPDEFLTGTDRNGDFINRYNFNQRTELIPASERTGYFGNFEYDITKNVSVFAEGLYQETRTKEIAAPTPVDIADGIFVPAVNPYNPFGTRVFPLFRLVEGGDRLTFTNSETERFIAGFRIKNLPNNWTAEFAGTSSENKVTSRGENFFSIQRAQEALFKTDPDKALNVFGAGEGFNSPQVIDGMRVSPYLLGRSEQRLVDFRASGDLPLATPAGPIAAGFGAEYREEELSVTPDPRSIPDPVTGFGDIIGSGGASANGQRSSKSVYYQVDIPLAGPTWNAPGIRALNLNFAGRYEEATDYGDTFKPKFSIRYKPVQNLTLRGSYQEGYRAPSLSQRFAGSVVGFETATDPQTGTTNDFRIISGGNSALQPEKSYSLSGGFVLDVPHVTGLSISADLYRIEQRDFIDAPTATTVLNNPGFGSVQRDPSGNILQINAPFQNIGLTVTDGLDFEVHYELAMERLRRMVPALLRHLHQQLRADSAAGTGECRIHPDSTLPCISLLRLYRLEVPWLRVGQRAQFHQRLL
jgi:outer membrane receptor protein involved in Fe transport